jgi:hypothetical protein
MNLARVLQVIFAIASIHSFLGWLLISVAFLIRSYEWLFNVIHNEAPPDPLRFFLILCTFLSWWGWFSLIWGFLFYRRLAIRYPKWMFLGNFFGAMTVLSIWVVFLVQMVDSSPVGLAEVYNIIIIFSILGGGPILLLIMNIVMVKKQVTNSLLGGCHNRRSNMDSPASDKG